MLRCQGQVEVQKCRHRHLTLAKIYIRYLCIVATDAQAFALYLPFLRNLRLLSRKGPSASKALFRALCEGGESEKKRV